MAKAKKVKQSKNNSNRKGSKKRVAKPQLPRRVTKSDVLTVMPETSHITWADLVEALGVDHPAGITQLRQLLKGLQRNDEIVRDRAGHFFLPKAKATFEGVVARKGKVFVVDDYLLERPPRALRDGDKVTYTVTDGAAAIVAVTDMSKELIVGVLKRRGRYPYVEALGQDKGRVGLTDPPAFGDDEDTVEVLVTGRDRRGLVGHVVGVIESTNTLDQAIATAVASGGIPHEWPQAVERAVAKLPKRVNPSQHKARTDLTGMALVTIDGETAKDFDDAVFAEPLPGRGRGWRLVVAIADVGQYVKLHSPLDLEAVNRGTSVYFPERVIPMLPEALSNGLCSLRPAEYRLTLVCDMHVGRNGKVKDFDFYEAVIYSHARLTYKEVHGFLSDGAKLPIDDAGVFKAVAKSIRTLHKVFRAMHTAREKRGALDFATHEGALMLEQGKVTAIQAVERNDAHRLIEEAMIAANVCAAEFLEFHERGALYRVHEPPDPSKLEELRQVLAYAGVTLAKGAIEPAALQAALERLPQHANRWLYGQFALRSLQQAIYTPDNQGHYGLALERYMHFTSPIRRYPDLVVHRAIKAVLHHKRQKSPTPDELQYLGEQCSTYERRAESAGWLVEGWLKCEFLEREVGNVVEGIIAGVTEFGLFVELGGYFVQGLLHVSNLGEDYYHYNPRSLSLEGERGGRRFVMGDQIRVVVADVDAPLGKVDLQLAQGSTGRSKKNRNAKTSGSKPRARRKR